jgi:putative endonuclease
MHFVYILECADKTLYVGCTKNLERRIEQHNKSKSGAHYTKIRRPVILKYQEEFKTLAEARKREAEIKNWKRTDKLKLFYKQQNRSAFRERPNDVREKL